MVDRERLKNLPGSTKVQGRFFSLMTNQINECQKYYNAHAELNDIFKSNLLFIITSILYRMNVNHPITRLPAPYGYGFCASIPENVESIE